MGPDLTFDTGVLFAWERRRKDVLDLVSTASEDGKRIFVPQVVIAEFWRGVAESEEARGSAEIVGV